MELVTHLVEARTYILKINFGGVCTIPLHIVIEMPTKIDKIVKASKEPFKKGENSLLMPYWFAVV